MGEPTAFLDTPRVPPRDRPVEERIRDHREVMLRLPIAEVRAQAGRCMDCGIPFCHATSSASGTPVSSRTPQGTGCPLNNVIPEFNDHVYRGRMAEASRTLGRTNNFPELTGRICPAPCERSCVLDLAGAPVTIESIERAIADDELARHGRFVPQPAERASGKRVAVVGSGPAGLAAAQELARAGHHVEVLEKSDRVGGLLRYGIPDFKLDKVWIDRRVAQMEGEGVVFRTGHAIGEDLTETLDALTARVDAVVLAVGAGVSRDLSVPGRSLDGIHAAMPFLEAENRRVADGVVGHEVPRDPALHAGGKRVVVIGGGDTGSDCIGTAVRQGATSVVNLELFPEPSTDRPATTPWPHWPLLLRTSSSHEEAAHVFGADVRRFALETVRFVGDEAGHVRAIEARPVRIETREGRSVILPVEGAALVTIEADLVLLAMGFTGADVAPLGLTPSSRGTIDATGHATSRPKVFTCGDARRGQSLVVWAIAEGRACARAVHETLGAELVTTR